MRAYVCAMTKLLGILNITEDSFSDGGKFLDPETARAHALALAKDADIIDIGAASSKPDAKPVAPDVEIARMAPVVGALKTQRRCRFRRHFRAGGSALGAGAGRRLSERHARLSRSGALSGARRVVGEADRDVFGAKGWDRRRASALPPEELLDRISRSSSSVSRRSTEAGVARERIILDPGMGLFLGSHPDASFTVLRHIAGLKAAFGLPVLISVSRKSFLRKLVGREVADIGPGHPGRRDCTPFVRARTTSAPTTPRALKDAMAVFRALDGNMA